MQIIENKNFPNERDLYGVNDVTINNCNFDGLEDGESALKEASNIIVNNSFFNLRYPFWHDENVKLNNITMTEKCRAALWYSKNIDIKDSSMMGIKALRECRDINIFSTKVVSPEFGWKSHFINIKDSNIESEYLFLLARNVNMEDTIFRGKYSFQYVEDAKILNCTLNTKDAFWHAKNIIVENCTVKGEYLAWYSENLTFINCKIIGTQPFCYCTNLKLINCEMIETDLSFEYSSVDATIKGNIDSVKNVASGKIECDSIKEIINTLDSKITPNCKIIERNKKSL